MAGLSISRKAGQTVVIESPGFCLVATVETTSRGKVVLTFDAPAEVRVYRGELFASIFGLDAYRDLPGQKLLFPEVAVRGGKDAATTAAV